MSQLNELLSLVQYPSKEKNELITKAYYFAERAHREQKRYSGEPYFNHVVETAKILAELGMGRRTISAGLLHDVLEDANITAEELDREFGKEILFLVEGVTKLGTVRYKGEERHMESLRKFFVATSKDMRVMIIKLADRLHNMRTLEFVPKEKRHRIAMETMEIYVPIAYRLGIRKIKREMEDYAFKYMDSGRYEEIRQMLKKKKIENEKRLEKFRRTLLKTFVKNNITDITSDMRLKGIYSIHMKMRAKNCEFEKIYDLYALRLQVKTIADCYKALGIIHSAWRPLPNRIKDYIAFPKPNGYQSLHTSIFTGDGDILEIQIRTPEMHQYAEFGMAAHITYKERKKESASSYSGWFRQFFSKKIFGSNEEKQRALVPEIDEERLKHIPQWITQLVDAQSYLTIPTEFIENLKSDFFEHRMFIFDQKGEVIDLPIGSTPIDFAYAIDHETGDHLARIKVNGKQVHFGNELKNGDVIELITKDSSRPTAKWLDECKTSLAKRRIRGALEHKNGNRNGNRGK